MTKPLVTIITPTYNQVDYIVETVRSVLSQTYENIEYIVIDDGSTDKTGEVLQQFSDQVKILRQQNAGQAATLNKGWDMAQGSLLGYLSSDDILYPDAVARLVKRLGDSPDASCIFPDCDVIDADSTVIKKNVCREFDLMKLIIEQECHIGPGALFRREAYNQTGGWNSDYTLAPDREFWARMAKLGDITFLPERLAGYRLHDQSISYKEYSDKVSHEYIRFLDDYFEKNSGVSVNIVNRKDEAYGNAYFLIARNALRAKNWKLAWHYYKTAGSLNPKLKSVPAKFQLVKTAASKPIRRILSKLSLA